MKYYIPTSSLNFNNILSSESISPKAFYSIRGFGYPRWTEIEENNNDNAILLYSKPFSFVRPASDLEDHPMLIEISTDETFPISEDGVSYCDHTIYLSPWRTRFVFFNSQDRVVALSLSDSSLETKMLALYRQRLIVKAFPMDNKKKIVIDIPLNTEAVERDFRINRLKGFLYGYYIGTLVSNSPEITKQANILQELRNIFSSIMSSESRMPTILQHEKLAILFNELQKNDPVVRYLQDVIKNPESLEVIISDLTHLGVTFPSNTNNKDSIIRSLEYATDDKSYAFEWLNREEKKLKDTEQNNRMPLLPSAEEVVVVDNSLSKIVNDSLKDETEANLLKAWCNEVLASKSYNGKVSTFAESLSDDITKKAKAVYGDLWDESYAKIVLNQMRRYVRAQESNISWKDDLFSSVAAVIAKGSDWEQLRKFMQSKSMSDYKMAFAMFAELNGFANLTRDFTDVLFNLQDRKYVASVYKEIYGQLLGEDPSIGYDNSSNLPDYIMLEPKNEDNNNCIEIGNLSDKVETIIKANPRRKISEKDKVVIKNALNKTQDGISFINMIANEMESLTKGIFPCFQKELHPDWKPIKTKRGLSKKNNTIEEQSLFSNVVDDISTMFEPKKVGKVNGNSIIYDVHVEKILDECTFIPFDIKKQIVSLFKEFQLSYQAGYYYKNQEQYKRNNSDVIDHFVKWCLSPKNKRAVKWSPENSKLMDELKLYLTNVYAD